MLEDDRIHKLEFDDYDGDYVAKFNVYSGRISIHGKDGHTFLDEFDVSTINNKPNNGNRNMLDSFMGNPVFKQWYHRRLIDYYDIQKPLTFRIKELIKTLKQ